MIETTPPRVRKSWSVATTWSRRRDEWDTVWAATASKARYQFKLDIGDCYTDIKFSDIHVRRNPSGDLVLPGEHRLVAELDREDRQILLHSYGGNHRRTPGYRDHYCTSPADGRLHRLAWELGLFNGPFGREDHSGEIENWSGAFYHLSELGKHVARSMMPLYL